MKDFLLKLKPGDVFITLVDNWEDNNVSIEVYKTLAVCIDSNVFVDRISYFLNEDEEFESEREKLMIDIDYFPNNGNLFLIENNYWDLAKKAYSSMDKKIFEQINDELQVLIEFMEENL